MNPSRLLGILSAVCVLGVAACGGSAAPSGSPAASSAAASSSKPAANSSVSAASSRAAASAKPSGGQALIKVKAAYSQISAVQGAMYVASDRHFFEKYGLDVSLSRVSGTQQVPAMSSGELQFGTPGGNELLSADMGGANIVMIAVNSNYPLFSLYGAKGINDVKDLAGKAVAVTTAGSSTDAAAKVYLQHFGLEKQVKLQPAATVPGILAVMEKGGAAGGILSPPTTVGAEKEGFKELVNGAKLGVPMVHAGVTVMRDYLKANPDVVKRFLQGYLDGWKFVTDPANEAAVEQTLVKWTKSDPQTAKDSYKYVFPAWAKDKAPTVNVEGLKTILATMDDPRAKDVKPEQFVDNSILEAIAK